MKYNAFYIIHDAEEKLRQSWSEKEGKKKRKSSVVLLRLADYLKLINYNLEVWKKYSSFIGACSIKLDINQFYEKVYKEFEFKLEKETDGCKTYSELVAKIEYLQRKILAPAAGSFSSDGVAKAPSFIIYV